MTKLDADLRRRLTVNEFDDAFDYIDFTAIDAKIGKLIVNENMSVIARPKLKSYNGQALKGAYEIDSEGVVPATELVLIENGVLKNLLNDRSLIKPAEVATGHADGPGVIEIDFKGGLSHDRLKEQLIAEAKKEHLDYALILEQDDEDDMIGTKCIKVFTDGREQVYRGGMLMGLAMKDLKSSLVAWSKDKKAFNSDGKRNAVVMSTIVNDAILLKDIEVEREDRSFYKEERYITSPLTQK